jgi:CubicO group peptidase (beta-lactamase class C family)
MQAAAAIAVFLLFASCHVGRYIIYNFADINDYKKFPSSKLERPAVPFQFKRGTVANTVRMPDSLPAFDKRIPYTAGSFESTNTVAFIVIRNDSILYEWFDKDFSEGSVVPSFSMAKSFVSILIGIAIDEGYIKSTAEPITNYLDFLDKGTFGKITIQHALDMQTGIRYTEQYFNPFSDVAKYYYGRNLRKYVRHMKIKKEPGREFDYISVNTQLLGFVLEKATGRSMTAYMQEKLWTPLGMQYDATWSLDSRKHHTEKAFSSINAGAIDFVKFGRLYLNKGDWNGRRIVSEKWVEESLTIRNTINELEYSNQWWHNIKWYRVEDTAGKTIPAPNFIYTDHRKGKAQQYVIYPAGDFFANGFGGQFMYVHPEKKIICVRLGRKPGGIQWDFFLRELAEKN